MNLILCYTKLVRKMHSELDDTLLESSSNET